jgi:hypothetical protein
VLQLGEPKVSPAPYWVNEALYVWAVAREARIGRRMVEECMVKDWLFESTCAFGGSENGGICSCSMFPVKRITEK